MSVRLSGDSWVEKALPCRTSPSSDQMRQEEQKLLLCGNMPEFKMQQQGTTLMRIDNLGLGPWAAGLGLQALGCG